MNSLTQLTTDVNPVAAIVTAYAANGQRFVTVHQTDAGRVLLYRDLRGNLTLGHFPAITPAMSMTPLTIEDYAGTLADETTVREWLTECAALFKAKAKAEAQIEVEAETEAIAAPARPYDAIDAAVDGLLTEYHDHPRLGDFAKRLASAEALVRDGQTEFPRYNTSFEFQGFYGRRTCQCKDAQYRGLSARFGTVCKHTLAMEIARRVEAEQGAVAGRRLVDKVEAKAKAEAKAEARPSTGSGRETALPARVDRRESLDDWLSYGETETVEQQMAAARAGLGAALAPGYHGRAWRERR